MQRALGRTRNGGLATRIKWLAKRHLSKLFNTWRFVLNERPAAARRLDSSLKLPHALSAAVHVRGYSYTLHRDTGHSSLNKTLLLGMLHVSCYTCHKTVTTVLHAMVCTVHAASSGLPVGRCAPAAQAHFFYHHGAFLTVRPGPVCHPPPNLVINMALRAGPWPRAHNCTVYRYDPLLPSTCPSVELFAGCMAVTVPPLWYWYWYSSSRVCGGVPTPARTCTSSRCLEDLRIFTRTNFPSQGRSLCPMNRFQVIFGNYNTSSLRAL